MNEFRRLAAKIDQHMQQLAAQGVSEAHAIIGANAAEGHLYIWLKRGNPTYSGQDNAVHQEN